MSPEGERRLAVSLQIEIDEESGSKKLTYCHPRV